MKKEEWRFIAGYDSYMVSNYGNVKSLNFKRHGEERLLKQHYIKKYHRVSLFKDGAWKYSLVHDLVARAFPEICGEWFEGAQVNHKDENPENNYAWNLEVCTASYNCNYGSRNKKMRGRKPRCVFQFDLTGNLVNKWNSAKEVQEELCGFSEVSIRLCCEGRQMKHNGFYWSYNENIADF